MLEDHILEVSGGDNDGDVSFGEGIYIRIVSSCNSAGGSSIEDAILSRFLLGDIVLEAEKSLLSVEFISVQIDHIILEVLAHAALFDIH